MQLDRDGWFGAPKHDIEQQIMYAIQGGAAAVYIQGLDGFPAHIGRKQTSQTQDVIQVAMGDQDLIKALKTNTRLKNLALCTLPAVDQEAVLVMLDYLGRKSAPCRRRRRGCP
jgi:H2-forming N5,N10-methylenetetrahydromethanopterin dehydrogenase-like enzyme